MTENDAAELPEMMVAEVVEVVDKEAPPIIPAQELEIETVKEKETVTEIEQLAKIKTIIVNVHVVRLLEVAHKIALPVE